MGRASPAGGTRAKAVGPLRAPRESCARATSRVGLCPRAWESGHRLASVHLRKVAPSGGKHQPGREAAGGWGPRAQGAATVSRSPGGAGGGCLSCPSLPWLPLGSPCRNRGCPRVAAASSCRLPKDALGGRREDLCQRSTLSPPNQLPPPAAEDALPNPGPGRPHRPPPVQLWTVSLLIPGSDRRRPEPSRQPHRARPPRRAAGTPAAAPPPHQQGPTPVSQTAPSTGTRHSGEEKHTHCGTIVPGLMSLL